MKLPRVKKRKRHFSLLRLVFGIVRRLGVLRLLLIAAGLAAGYLLGQKNVRDEWNIIE